MELKRRTEVYHYVEYSDLELFIRHHYPDAREYEFVAEEECSNDVKISFDIDGEVDDWDEETIFKFASGQGTMYATRAIMQDLCRRDLIKPGKYLIEVSW